MADARQMLAGVNICIKHSECKALDENGGNCSRSFSRIPERHSGDGYILGISCKSWQIMGGFIFIVVVMLIALGWWINFNEKQKSPKEIAQIERCLIRIEENPGIPLLYEELLQTLNACNWMRLQDVVKPTGVYDRLLEILKAHPENSLSYKAVARLLAKLKFPAKMSEDKGHKQIDKRALQVVVDSLNACFIDTLVYDEIINILEISWSLSHELTQTIGRKSLALLIRNPLDTVVQGKVIRILDQCPALKVAETKAVYEAALDILANNPSNPTAKQFVLNVGRWHFGRSRPDKRPTVYDEQAIQNDILVRST